MAFFERFRVELRKYADGVNDLGDAEPSPPEALPAELRELYRSWNGARLFADTIVIVPAAQVTAAPSGWRIGEWPEGTLELDSDGRVRSRDDDGAAIVVGSSLERFLAAVMAREGVLVDREGEFKDVFDEDGITPRARARQTEVALKLDGLAAAWHLEAAERAFAEGDDAAVEAALARAVAIDEGAGEAWALLGALQRRAQRLDAAEASFARAAAAAPTAATRAERAAEAARAASEAGREEARAGHAATARAADAEAVARWIAEGRALLDGGDAEGALNRATLAAAVDPDGDAKGLVREARTRSRLRVLT
jgi:tetratricopeptide (TPR) repeat protein